MPNPLFNVEFDRLLASLAQSRVHWDKFIMNEFVLIFLFFSVNMCLNVPPPPSLTFTRSVTLVKHLYIDPTNTCRLFLLCICLTVIILPNIDLNCRFVSFSTRLNTLKPKSNKTASQHFLLLFLSYVILFEYYLIIFLPFEFFNVHLKVRWKNLIVIVKMVHCGIATTTTDLFRNMGTTVDCSK